MLLTLHLEKEFDALFLSMDQKNTESDIAQKMRLFRMRILKSYFSLEKGDILFATQQIEQALDFMYGSTFPPKKKESMVLVEKASYHLWADQWDVAKEEIRKALELDPNNTISQQIYLKMGSP
jgi:Tfp pilus assembly protein PilF